MRRMFPLAMVVCLSARTTAAAQLTDRIQQILSATQLPVSAAQARNEGVSNGELRAVLDAMRNARLPAHEARVIIDEERNARREHGAVDNFGAFVQSRLQAGLRGRDLAAAIRAEHVARGKGGNRAAQAQGAKGAQATKTSPTTTKTKTTPTKTKATTQKGRPTTDTKRPDTKRRPD